MKSINPKTKQPYKLLWFGDLVAPSGFGRIGNEVTRRLAQRGYQVQGAAINYEGWPHSLPLAHVWPLGGRDIWGGLATIVQATQPDLLISCQDFPYHQTIWNAVKLDFSRLKWVWITPIDGTPIHPEWLKLCRFPDGKMVISRFGQEAFRQAGHRVELLHPGVDTGEFYPAAPEERAALRAKVGWGAAEFVVGVMCMNQGRKAIAPMLQAFREFAQDKPNARLYLDMDAVSPAGWDLPSLMVQMGWTEAERGRVKFRADVFQAGEDLLPLRNRYALLDAHMVISHREGFGLPLLESLACRLPTLALDWCSGPELVGGGRGWLVRRIAYMEHGTWGGALDAFPDLPHLVECLNDIYYRPSAAAAVAASGYEWAVRQTWDVATDQTETVIQAALTRQRSQEPNDRPLPDASPNPAPGLSDVYGPVAEPVSGDPGLQRHGQTAEAPQEPDGDGSGDGQPLA